MSDVLISALCGFAGVAVTAILGYFASSRSSKNALTDTERKLLSEDQREFRQALLDSFKTTSEQMEILQRQNTELLKANADLKTELAVVQKQNESLKESMRKLKDQNKKLSEENHLLKIDLEALRADIAAGILQRKD